MIANRPTQAFSHLTSEFGRKAGPRSAFQERFHDQRQRRASRGGPSSPVERSGAVYQGPVVRKSERTLLAGAASAAAGDQHPDQRQRQQYRRKRIRSDAFGRG